MPMLQFQDVNEKLSNSSRPWHRSFQFWVRAVDIYTGYKICQFRVRLVKGAQKQEAMWEAQHELAADKIYSLCSELGGFFLKVAQLIGKPDLAPAAWVRRLVTLCDRAPATSFELVQVVLKRELGKSVGELFEKFDPDPVGSASIAQVHRARIRGGGRDVAVKVQHPGIQELMMTDIHNLQAFALFLQKTDIKFDLLSVTKEIEKQVGYEFDFVREAEAMGRIQQFLSANNKKGLPVLVPRVTPNLVTRKVLVMDFIEGTPIMNLGDEMAKRGINPGGKMAQLAKQKILSSLTQAYGQMIFKSGFFHADPHPGNILICKNSEVALLDYGQVKHLPENLRIGCANLILGIADNDPLQIEQSYKELGIGTSSRCANAQQEMLKLARAMFDTQLPPGVTVASPFSEESSIKKVAVQSFPEELFCVLRTVQLLRGLSVGLGINYSCAEQWKPFAEEALIAAGRLKGRNHSQRLPRWIHRPRRAARGDTVVTNCDKRKTKKNV
ncbi:hypothetical protein H6P81_012533 [Aristolochia fimbriata]|uniref:Protein kinase domain-containing protein n=1 Tax=Aristolochia fimbriata TaxID=158543 RepID=A0AAV7EC29_ARIFI|nr:hypothetical protein H6P81_012533 [Aristolochia fimbriata]